MSDVIAPQQPVVVQSAVPAALVQAAEEQLLSRKEERQAKRAAEARAEGANEVLKSLGIKKNDRARMIEEIKAGRVKLADKTKEAEATKKEADAAAAQVDNLKPFRDENEKLRGTLKKYADVEFEALPEPLQKVIVEMKLDDPQARLDMIEMFKRTGALPPKQTAATATGEKKVEPKRELSTTMADAKQQNSPGGVTMNHYQQWKQLTDSKQHFLAAQYFQANKNKIMEQRTN